MKKKRRYLIYFTICLFVLLTFGIGCSFWRQGSRDAQQYVRVIHGCNPTPIRILEPVPGTTVSFPLKVRIKLGFGCSWNTFERVAGSVDVYEPSFISAFDHSLGGTSLHATGGLSPLIGDREYAGVIDLKEKVDGSLTLVISEEDAEGDGGEQRIAFDVYVSTSTK